MDYKEAEVASSVLDFEASLEYYVKKWKAGDLGNFEVEFYALCNQFVEQKLQGSAVIDVDVTKFHAVAGTYELKHFLANHADRYDAEGIRRHVQKVLRKLYATKTLHVKNQQTFNLSSERFGIGIGYTSQSEESKTVPDVTALALTLGFVVVALALIFTKAKQ